MMHSGSMDYKMTAKCMKLFAEEVVPQVKHLGNKRPQFGPLSEWKTAPKRRNGAKAKPNGKRKAA
jgi:hypothetical protein